MASSFGVVLAVALLGSLACVVHAASSREPRRNRETRLADRIDALLPQTQCAQCGYAGCRPYAEAMANGAADINRCPPGGRRTVALLAELLGGVAKDLDPALPPATDPLVAHIDEQTCIGCVKCVRACPVDAILGAAGQMHTVIPGLCTGCGLCLPPCPVDCIDMRPPVAALRGRMWAKPGPAYEQVA